MALKRANGQGTIIKDKSGKRRNPYRVRVTIGWELDPKTGKMKQVFDNLGSFKTQAEAQKALTDYNSSTLNERRRHITFAELFEEWQEYYFSKGHESYRYKVTSAFNYCSTLHKRQFRDISIIELEKCIDTCYIISPRGKNKGEKQFASPSTKKDIKFLFNRMYEFGVKAKYVDRNLAKDFTLDIQVERQLESEREEGQPFTEEELNILWQNENTFPFVDVILLHCYSGWRPSEIVKLEIKDIDLEVGCMTGGIKTDAGKDRTVPIHPRVRHIVENKYREAELIGSPYLLNNTDKNKIKHGFSYYTYNIRFQAVTRKLLKREGFTPHDARHTFITRARKAGIDSLIIKRLVGHKVKDITEGVYTHWSIEDYKKEMDKIQ